MSDYVMVPREPTRAMQEAFFDANAKAVTVFAGVPELWAAMLAAAPTPPAGEVFAYTRTNKFADPLPVISPAEYRMLVGNGLGQAFKPLTLGAAAAPREPAPAVGGNPLLAYAESYRIMARTGNGRVNALDVAIDIENNMAKHAAPPPVDSELQRDAERYRWLRERSVEFSTGYYISSFKGKRMDDVIDAAIQARRQQETK